MSRRNAALDRSLEQNIQELLDLHEYYCPTNHRELGALARCLFPWWDHQGAGRYGVVGLGHVASFRKRAEAEARRDPDEPDLYVVVDVWRGKILDPGDRGDEPGTRPLDEPGYVATFTGLPGV
jgi:hypothetical protein